MHEAKNFNFSIQQDIDYYMLGINSKDLKKVDLKTKKNFKVTQFAQSQKS